mgnify:CR=1 FL=1
MDSSVEIDTLKKFNVSGSPKGILGFVLKKMRYYNLMPKFAISKPLVIIEPAHIKGATSSSASSGGILKISLPFFKIICFQNLFKLLK